MALVQIYYALTDESMQVVQEAAKQHGRGILVHNDAQHYSAGVDLNAFLALIDQQNWSEIDAFLAGHNPDCTSMQQQLVGIEQETHRSLTSSADR